MSLHWQFALVVLTGFHLTPVRIGVWTVVMVLAGFNSGQYFFEETQYTPCMGLDRSFARRSLPTGGAGVQMPIGRILPVHEVKQSLIGLRIFC
jgi:hypothetical protein